MAKLRISLKDWGTLVVIETNLKKPNAEEMVRVVWSGEWGFELKTASHLTRKMNQLVKFICEKMHYSASLFLIAVFEIFHI